MKFLTISLVALFLISCGKTGDLTKADDTISMKAHDTANMKADDTANMKAVEMKLSKQDVKKKVLTQEVEMQEPMIEKKHTQSKALMFDTGIRPTNSK